jgi:hypothetical protein
MIINVLPVYGWGWRSNTESVDVPSAFKMNVLNNEHEIIENTLLGYIVHPIEHVYYNYKAELSKRHGIDYNIILESSVGHRITGCGQIKVENNQ